MLSQTQKETLQNLKNQMEAAEKNPAKCADGSYNFMGYSPNLSVGGRMAPKRTIAALVRMGLVDISTQYGCLTVAAINQAGLKAIA